MKSFAGCLVALIIAPLVVVVLIFALAGGVTQAFTAALGGSRGGSATLSGRPTIYNLGAGQSDAARIEAFIARLQPNSPMLGYGAFIVALARATGLDPLLIVVWKQESQMATVGLNVPNNGGNLTWDAAAPYAAAWDCTPGPSSLNHRWAACPSMQSGLGAWFHYMAGRYAGTPDFVEAMSIYNPCSDPGNAANGFPCGEVYAGILLGFVREHAGAPVFDTTGYRFPVVGYQGGIDLHWGVERGGADLFAPEGTPLLAMRGGTVSYAGYDITAGNAVRIEGTDGNAYWYAHLSAAPLVTTGQLVSTGQPIGLVGRSGNAHAAGPHLHLGIGPTIVIGGGPTGGLGSDGFDAVALLRAVYACCP